MSSSTTTADFHALPLLGGEQRGGMNYPWARVSRGLCIAIVVCMAVSAAALGVVFGIGVHDQVRGLTLLRPDDDGKEAMSLAVEVPAKLQTPINVTIVELSSSLLPALDVGQMPQVAVEAPGAMELFNYNNGIVNRGKSKWDLLAAGKHIPHPTIPFATGLPPCASNCGEQGWWDMWKNYRIEVAGSGILFTATIRVSMYCRGTYNGKGAYINDLEVRVFSWNRGYDHVNPFIDVAFRDPINVGTKEDPVAKLIFNIHWRQDSHQGHYYGAMEFSAVGDCQIEREKPLEFRSVHSYSSTHDDSSP